jgi:hypothetical protein
VSLAQKAVLDHAVAEGHLVQECAGQVQPGQRDSLQQRPFKASQPIAVYFSSPGQVVPLLPKLPATVKACAASLP